MLLFWILMMDSVRTCWIRRNSRIKFSKYRKPEDLKKITIYKKYRVYLTQMAFIYKKYKQTEKMKRITIYVFYGKISSTCHNLPYKKIFIIFLTNKYCFSKLILRKLPYCYIIEHIFEENSISILYVKNVNFKNCLFLTKFYNTLTLSKTTKKSIYKT